MGDAKEILELVEESDEFEQCSDCGRYLVRPSNHHCREDGETQNKPNRDERDRRAEEDTRGDDTLVGVYGRDGGTTYAYHDLANGKPRCGCHHQTNVTELDVVTLVRAKARGRSPCGNCRRVRRTRDGDGSDRRTDEHRGR